MEQTLNQVSPQDGCISWGELQQAYEDNKDLRACLVTLDIDKDDLECLFHLMDIDLDAFLHVRGPAQ